VEQLDGSRWRKSSYSDNGGADCVEVGLGPEAQSVLVRDTKGPFGSCLAVHLRCLAHLR
jgi:Domain of unknown function (DUF397)